MTLQTCYCLFCREIIVLLKRNTFFPTPAFPADPTDPPDPADPADPPDPGKMVPELALRPSLPHAPEVRMT